MGFLLLVVHRGAADVLARRIGPRHSHCATLAVRRHYDFAAERNFTAAFICKRRGVFVELGV